MAKDERFGEWSIDQKVFGWILSNIPVGSSILELGSGWATGELARYYKMHSIEDYDSFVGLYNSHYIYAESSKSNWYDREVLEKELPNISYDLILIDGPSHEKRWKIIEHMDLFHWNVPVIVDDCQEGDILMLANDIAKKYCKRESHLIQGNTKQTLVIP